MDGYRGMVGLGAEVGGGAMGVKEHKSTDRSGDLSLFARRGAETRHERRGQMGKMGWGEEAGAVHVRKEEWARGVAEAGV